MNKLTIPLLWIIFGCASLYGAYAYAEIPTSLKEQTDLGIILFIAFIYQLFLLLQVTANSRSQAQQAFQSSSEEPWFPG